MFGLDFSEILIIGVVALIVVGPKELPELMRSVGRFLGRARRMASEFQGQMSEALREADLEDVKKSVDDLRSLSPKNLIAEQFSSVTRTLDEVKRETDATVSAIGASVAETPAVPAPTPAPSEVATASDPFGETGPALPETEVAARIDTAAAASTDLAPMDLAPPVFDLTPAPGSPVETAAATPVEPKKEREA